MSSSQTAFSRAFLLLAILHLTTTNAMDMSRQEEKGATESDSWEALAEDVSATEAILKSGKQVVHVENNGSDGQTCGTRSDPCRSITRAIINAREHSIIVVGPGIYGDLNRDGVLGGVGEEVARCGAMICVDKAVRLVSRKGALRTVIDATGVASPTNAVRLWDDVRFGQFKRGFTIRGAKNHAVQTDARNVWIIDNIAAASMVGFAAIQRSSDCLLVGNLSGGNISQGFLVFGESHRVEFNVAQSNGSTGFWLIGNGHRLHGNTAVGNVDGVVINDASNNMLIRNAFLANSRTGVLILQDVTGAVVRFNNIFGNGEGLGDTTNRGLVNTSGALVRATKNFWGGATGPGPNPSDDVVTNRVSQTWFEPVAREAFKIRSRP